MEILRAYKTELDPNNMQRTQFERFAEVHRFVFNIGLREWQRQYKQGEKPSAYGLRKQFGAVKDELFPDVRDAPYAVMEKAFYDLGTAYKNFFRRVKQGKKPGYPKIKRSANGFALRGTVVEHNRVRLRGVGWVRLKECGYIPETVSGTKFSTYATLSQRAGRWFISVGVKTEASNLMDRHDTVIGVDFGVKTLATCSNGRVFENSKPLKAAQRRLRMLNKELSRRTKGGANWRKTQKRLAKVHKRVADMRAHALHQVSDYLTQEVRPATIVLEDLNVKGMVSNHSLALAISDAGFFELRRQIEYKAGWLGEDVVLADRWYPSSKTCNQCGVVKNELALSDRTFVCADCGFTLDRDLNAALNLAALGRNRQAGGDMPAEMGCSNAPL